MKEIDVEIGILRLYVNGSFNLTVWAPFRTGGPSSSDNGTLTDDPPWHEAVRYQWKWLRAISVTTVGLGELNTFPFETYETEIVFGLSVPNITTELNDPYLSWELEQQGYWTVDAFFRNTSNSKISSINATHERIIEERELESFISLFIRLRHPEAYQLKMAFPTWGTVGLALGILFFQFSFLRRKMRRSEHISMFVAVAVFLLGISFVMREMTPPELTFPELLSFLLALIYSAALFVTIYRGSHKMNEEKEEMTTEGKQLKETKMSKEKKKPRALEDKVIESHARFLKATKDTYPLAVLGSLSIAIAAFTKDTLALASTYAIASACLFLIAFICSLVVKFLPNAIYTLASYVFAGSGIGSLLLIIVEFANSSPKVFHIVSSIGLIFLILTLSVLLSYVRKTCKVPKLRIIRFMGYATIILGVLFILSLIPIIYIYILELELAIPPLYFILLPPIFYGFAILYLATSILVIAQWIRLAIKQRRKSVASKS